MVTSVTIPKVLLSIIRDDLEREIPSHVDALERVGFLFFKLNSGGDLVPTTYLPLEDTDYLDRENQFVGVRYGGEAIHRAIVHVIRTNEFFCTIHIHGGHGKPWPSRTDLKSEKELVDCFLKISIGPHGAIILSDDSLLVRCWDSNINDITDIENVSISDKEDK